MVGCLVPVTTNVRDPMVACGDREEVGKAAMLSVKDGRAIDDDLLGLDTE
jgi:hypothetical protein